MRRFGKLNSHRSSSPASARCSTCSHVYIAISCLFLLSQTRRKPYATLWRVDRSSTTRSTLQSPAASIGAQRPDLCVSPRQGARWRVTTTLRTERYGTARRRLLRRIEQTACIDRMSDRSHYRQHGAYTVFLRAPVRTHRFCLCVEQQAEKGGNGNSRDLREIGVVAKGDSATRWDESGIKRRADLVMMLEGLSSLRQSDMNENTRGDA